MLLLRFQLIGRYQIFVIFIQLLFIYFRIARFDFLLSFSILLNCFCLFFLVFLGLLRPYLVLESHLVFFWIYLWFSGFSVSLSVSGFVSGTVWFPESVSGSGVTSGFLQGLFQVLIYCLALVEFLYRVLLRFYFRFLFSVWIFCRRYFWLIFISLVYLLVLQQDLLLSRWLNLAQLSAADYTALNDDRSVVHLIP